MIFVSLGTQDKSFVRLLETIDDAIEKGIITEPVVAQIGQTVYTPKHMECFGFIENQKMSDYIEKCSCVVCHGGVGTISNGVAHGKPVIATPRLAKYGEHHNDHQKQIIEKMAEDGCLIPMWKMEDLKDCLEKAKTFVPKPIQSNAAHFQDVVRQYLNKI